MLERELARDSVHAAHPLHRDEKGLVAGQATGLQGGDLFAQMVFHLVDVGDRNRAMALDVPAPLIDMGLQLGLHHAHPFSTGPVALRQTWSSASATTLHWACRSASAARPESVIK